MDTETGDKARRRELVEARNERRRIRYAQDQEYREQVRQQSRQTYEKLEGKDLSSVAAEVAERLAGLDKLASVRPVFVEKTPVGEHACLTEAEMAVVVGRNPQIFQRMVADGRWPKPLYSARNYRSKVGVFLLEEARVLIEVFLEHLKTSLHYYQSHTDTRNALQAALDRLREEIGADKWVKLLQG